MCLLLARKPIRRSSVNDARLGGRFDVTWKMALCALASLALAFAQAQPSIEIPDTPAARQFQLWLAEMNSGDPDAIAGRPEWDEHCTPS